MKFQKMSYTQGILVSHKLLKLTIIQPHKAKKSLSRRANSLLKNEISLFLPILTFIGSPLPLLSTKTPKT